MCRSAVLSDCQAPLTERGSVMFLTCCCSLQLNWSAGFAACAQFDAGGSDQRDPRLCYYYWWWWSVTSAMVAAQYVLTSDLREDSAAKLREDEMQFSLFALDIKKTDVWGTCTLSISVFFQFIHLFHYSSETNRLLLTPLHLITSVHSYLENINQQIIKHDIL